jgi:hypothetical protein
VDIGLYSGIFLKKTRIKSFYSTISIDGAIGRFSEYAFPALVSRDIPLLVRELFTGEEDAGVTDPSPCWWHFSGKEVRSGSENKGYPRREDRLEYVKVSPPGTSSLGLLPLSWRRSPYQ